MAIETLNKMFATHPEVLTNLKRTEITRYAIEYREALVMPCGALSTWTPPESTGRSPKDTVIVRHPELEEYIDWSSPNNLSIDPDTFYSLWVDALTTLWKKPRIFVTDRVIGADPDYAMPVKTITNYALTSLFTLNMFRPLPQNIENSIFADKPFTLAVVPYDKIDTSRYEGRLRKCEDGSASDMIIAMDFKNRLGLVYGSAYCGSAKKLMFTAMNYYLPHENILPLHCSANEDRHGKVSLFLGLSGTGKTTLSADRDRALIGDDEHGWDEDGIANFEQGCYAKLIDLDPEKEPEIHNAVFNARETEENGVIIENCMTYPDGTVDVFDDRLTQNSRASYPLRYLENVKLKGTGTHPSTIIFLTADANGVLPPISRLNPEQAMLWFLMGYTSKLAGTETGIKEPQTTFSRFFGQPFMANKPKYYSDLLGRKMKEHDTRVFLVNTGWSGGPYGIGSRIDITLTRAMLNSALEEKLDEVEYTENNLFHINVPDSCPGVPSEMLHPENTWSDRDAFDKRAAALAKEFSDYFDKAYGDAEIDDAVRAQCPGK
ncbi:MAG: phosphoenolpyruvate carboxykinase (ATP) [Desulfobacteraceae bacterium]|nr:phosphoenolpyruvate carboxykinase (ATP) [Desulfobacteraceae bacterium]